MRGVLLTATVAALTATVLAPCVLAPPVRAEAGRPQRAALVGVSVVELGARFGGVRYLVAVEPLGGVPRGTVLTLSTAGEWAGVPSACVPAEESLICPLGDLTERRELRVGVRRPEVASRATGPVGTLFGNAVDALTAVVRASNAPEAVAGSEPGPE
ncbi:hypothetical protein, partial [Actinocorallia lasiicapitis]